MVAISVIMSVYKEPVDWLRQSIDSILNQTYNDFEFIIICDNPTYKEGITLLYEYASKDDRIHLIFNEENIGLTKSLNKGLALANGKYIARMDADDISMPTRFEKQYRYMEQHNNVIVLGTNFKYIGDVPLSYKIIKVVEFKNDRIKAHLLYGNCFAHSSVFIRRKVLIDNNIRYDETFRTSQDYRMWEVLLPYGDFANLEEKLLKYRLSSSQVTKTKPLNQIDQAYGISRRLQKRWLDKQNVLCTISDLENNPYKVLCELKRNEKIVNQCEFKAFLLFVYLESSNRGIAFHALLNGDFFVLSNQNKLLLLYKLIR